MSNDHSYSDPSVSADPRGRLVGGRYRLTGKIGEGGMGAVYKGFDQVIGRQVAIKMMGEGTTSKQEVVARFQREAQVVGQLRHRNVVEVFDFGIENGIPFMVMELLEGKDLATLLDKRGAIPIERAVDIVLAVAAGLSAAHERGLVHRDIKPANIFLSREDGDEIPKILDFGIAKTSNSRLTQAGSVFGTQHYISPEQARSSADVDARTDQYALGVILYQCLAGRPPHDGDNVYAIIKNIVEGRFAPPSTYRLGLPASLEAIVMKAMATEPHGRFDSVYEMGIALLPFASERGKRQWSDFYSRVPLGPEYSVAVPAADREIPGVAPTAVLPPEPKARAPQIAPTEVLPSTPLPPAPRVAPTVVLAPEPKAAPPSRPRRTKSGRVVRIREPLNAPRPASAPRRPWVRALALAVGLCLLAIAGLLFLRPGTSARSTVTAEPPAPPAAPPPSPAPLPSPAPINLPAPTTAPAAQEKVSKTNTPRKEKPRAPKKRRVRYNDDGVPLIMP
jgi:eukaryotic-like serine/threonine-protein kinase